eukprot:3658314-Alexandrium_andersonii.AAC.1
MGAWPGGPRVSPPGLAPGTQAHGAGRPLELLGRILHGSTGQRFASQRDLESHLQVEGAASARQR